MSLLEIKNLGKNFGGLKAVSNLNLDLPEGKLYGLIGPNGAGKTTVFNLLTGIYQPSAGSIKFAGEDLVGLKSFAITKKGVARTFQNIRLFGNLTVLDNIKVAFNYHIGYHLIDSIFRSRAFRAQERQILEESMNLLGLFGLEGKYNQLARNLPYGEQRRLEIARALATRPKLLLLDEPGAGMNPHEIDQLIELIRWIRGEFNLSILLIEHHMQVVMRLCERIAVMDFGETIAEGTPAEVQGNPRVIEAYLGEEEAEVV